MEVIKGISVCEGIAVGELFVYLKKENTISGLQCADPAAEWQRFSDAQQDADNRLQRLYEKALESMGAEQAEIFEMHRLMLEDLDYLDTIKAKIDDERMTAQDAVQLTGKEFAELFKSLDDPYMQGRASDVSDVSSLLVEILTGQSDNVNLTKPCIVIADDLTPSDTIKLDKSFVLAFVTRRGSGNSHTAILARTMGIPSLVKAEVPLEPSNTGKMAAVDGFEGLLYIEPEEPELARLAEKKAQEEARRLECEAVRGLPTETSKGKRVQLFANIGGNDDIAAVLSGDAEGIGLFRSEFLYLGKNAAPSEEEQFAAYKNVAEKMAGKKVIIRTMDIGADKQADYLGLKTEENPALGYRAIRICLDRKELFQAQLRAICRAAAFGKVSVMFPMIASVWEVQECKKALEEAKESLKAQGTPIGDLEVGIMIETPAAVMISDSLAKEVEFFSVGTNDLTQYTLAADRQNADIERYADPHHPAVFEMLRIIAENAHKNGIWAGICGELAGDISIVGKLLEMGYDELSVFPNAILPIRKYIREL